MRVLGFEITRAKQANLSPATSASGGWFGLIRESFSGAWQKNVEIKVDTVLTHSAVFRCISLISSDIAKMRLRLTEKDANGIRKVVERPAFSPVLRKPNTVQNRIQFFTNWMESKLIHGNTYVLKRRDNRGVVIGMFVLDPTRVMPLISEEGEIFYDLQTDHIAGLIETSVIVPSSEIIHDRWNTIHHPLVGTSPIHAAGLAATQGLRIQENSTNLFANGSNPGGILSAPGRINDDTAKRVKEHWERSYTGQNFGRVAVLGDGMKYEQMGLNAVDSQLIEQLRWSAETVTSVFGVPAYKIGVGPLPTHDNIEALNAQYYAQSLQIHIESIELGLDEGLRLPPRLGVQFELDDLLRMDARTKVQAAKEAIDAGFLAPNEARRKFDLAPVTGGNSPYMQQQNFSLAALAERDRNKPFAKPTAPAPAAAPDDPPQEDTVDGDGGDETRAARHVAAVGKLEKFARRHGRLAA